MVARFIELSIGRRWGVEIIETQSAALFQLQADQRNIVIEILCPGQQSDLGKQGIEDFFRGKGRLFFQ